MPCQCFTNICGSADRPPAEVSQPSTYIRSGMSYDSASGEQECLSEGFGGAHPFTLTRQHCPILIKFCHFTHRCRAIHCYSLPGRWAGFQPLPAWFSAGMLSARLMLSAVGPWLVSLLPESCVLLLGDFFLVVCLVFRWACNLAAPGLNALGATIVCSDSCYGIAPLRWKLDLCLCGEHEGSDRRALPVAPSREGVFCWESSSQRTGLRES